jgi:hypothetical protein
MIEDDPVLAEAVASRREEMVDGESGFIGECREAVPFGETFYVFSDGKEYRSCTHKPPHTHPVS